MRFKFILFFLLLCFTYMEAVPVVSSVSPYFGTSAGGQIITITGSGFNGTSAVTFGPYTSPFFIVNSDSSITAITPQAVAGNVDVRVTASGTSALTRADTYTFQGDWFAYANNISLSPQAHYINLSTFTTAVPLLKTGYGVPVAIDPYGRKAYMSTDGTTGPGQISIVDIATNSVSAPIALPVGEDVYTLAITPDGSTLYAGVRTGSTGHLLAMDLSTNSIGTPILIPSSLLPNGIAISSDGQIIYIVTNLGILLYHIDSDTFDPAISAIGFQSITLLPDGSYAYVIHWDDPDIFIYRLNLTSLVLDSPITAGAAGGGGPGQYIAATPDGLKVNSAMWDDGPIVNLYPTNTSTYTVGIGITVGVSSNGLTNAPDSKNAYVTTGVGYSRVNLNIGALDDVLVSSEPSGIAITPDQAPVAYFSTSGSGYQSPTTFNASASLSPVGTIALYEWNFGDGQTASTTNPLIQHTYASPGTYSVTLTVTNSAGTSTTQTFTGQTVSNNGSSLATLTQTVNVNIQTPLNFQGTVRKNKFLPEVEYIHVLTWNPSPNPSVIGYYLYRNDKFLAFIPATGPFIYEDQKRHKKKKDKYTLYAVIGTGQVSPPIIIYV